DSRGTDGGEDNIEAAAGSAGGGGAMCVVVTGSLTTAVACACGSGGSSATSGGIELVGAGTVFAGGGREGAVAGPRGGGTTAGGWQLDRAFEECQGVVTAALGGKVLAVFAKHDGIVGRDQHQLTQRLCGATEVAGLAQRLRVADRSLKVGGPVRGVCIRRRSV